MSLPHLHSSLAHFHPPFDSYASDASSLVDDDASSLASDDTTSPTSNVCQDPPALDYPDSDDDSDSEDDMPALMYHYSGYESSDDEMSVSSEPDSSYPAFSAPAPESVAPIRVSPKPPKGKRRKNAFIDDRGFPDQSDELDTLLHSMDGEPILRKRRHPAPALDDIDPAFDFKYDETLHGAQFREDFTPSPRLTPSQNEALANLIKKYWAVFDHRGLFVPVKDYVCDIDTGSAKPIAY